MLYLSKSSRWTGRFYYSEYWEDYTLSFTNIDSQVCPSPTSLLSHRLLLWDSLSFLKPCETERSKEKEREGWHYTLEQRSVFHCFHTETLSFAAAERSLVIADRAGQETGQPGILLVLISIQTRIWAFRKERHQWSRLCVIWEQKLMLSWLLLIPYFFYILSLLLLANYFKMKLCMCFNFDLNCNCVHLCPLPSFCWEKEHRSSGFFLSTEDSLIILTKLNEEKRPSSVAIKINL